MRGIASGNDRCMRDLVAGTPEPRGWCAGVGRHAQSGCVVGASAYLNLPVFAIVGARNWLTKGSRDSAKRFARPILEAWGLDYVVIEQVSEKGKLADHFLHCQAEKKPGIVVLAEGSG